MVRTVLPPTLQKFGEPHHVGERAMRFVHALADAVYRDADCALVRDSDAPHTLWERLVRDVSLHAAPRVRVDVLAMLPDVHARWPRRPLRPLLPALVANVQDAHPDVRAAAEAALVRLVRTAPPHAVAELHAAMEEHGVPRALQDTILAEVRPPPEKAPDASVPLSPQPAQALSASTALSTSTTSAPPPLPTYLAEIPMDDVKSVPLYARHDIDALFASAPFEGKETEDNWQRREKVVLQLRGVLKEAWPPAYTAAFLAHIRPFQDALLKALASLRTTLSMHTIYLLRQLVLTFGAELDACLDVFFSALVRMAGFTKKLVANASQVAVSTILATTPLRSVYWHQLQHALQDKSITTRVWMCKHMDVILLMHAHRRTSVEAHGGLDMLLHTLPRVLADQNPDVRAAARDVFARFRTTWPTHAATLMASLPPATRKQTSAALDQSTEPKKPARSGPSHTVLAAKRAAMLANSPRRESLSVSRHDVPVAPAGAPETPRAKPRASVWHPRLLDPAHSDASSDLMDSASPWRGNELGEGAAGADAVAHAMDAMGFEKEEEEAKLVEFREEPEPTRHATPPATPEAEPAKVQGDTFARGTERTQIGVAAEPAETAEPASPAAGNDAARPGTLTEPRRQELYADDVHDASSDKAAFVLANANLDTPQTTPASAHKTGQAATELPEMVKGTEAPREIPAAPAPFSDGDAAATPPSKAGRSLAASDPLPTQPTPPPPHEPPFEPSPPATPRRTAAASSEPDLSPAPRTPTSSQVHAFPCTTPLGPSPLVLRYFLARCERETLLAGSTPLAVCMERVSDGTAEAAILRDLGYHCLHYSAADADVWRGHMHAVLAGLSTYTNPPHADLWPLALIVLYRLVDSAYDALRADDAEADWLDAVLHGEQETGAAYALAQGAGRAMMEAWSARAPPVPALPLLLGAYARANPSTDEAAVRLPVLVLNALGPLLTRTPSASLLEAVRATRPLVNSVRSLSHQTLSDPHPAVRRAAIGALVHIDHALQDWPTLVAEYALTRTQSRLLQVRARCVLTQHYVSTTVFATPPASRS